MFCLVLWVSIVFCRAITEHYCSLASRSSVIFVSHSQGILACWPLKGHYFLPATQGVISSRPLAGLYFFPSNQKALFLLATQRTLVLTGHLEGVIAYWLLRERYCLLGTQRALFLTSHFKGIICTGHLEGVNSCQSLKSHFSYWPLRGLCFLPTTWRALLLPATKRALFLTSHSEGITPTGHSEGAIAFLSITCPKSPCREEGTWGNRPRPHTLGGPKIL